MKKKILTSIFLASLLATSTPILAAEKTAENTVNLVQTSKVLENLQAKGFSIVSEIEFTDGNYKAKVINAEGKSSGIVYNPQTGEIVQENQNKPGLTALDIARAVESAGFYNITKIDTQWLQDKYNVTAYDKTGEKRDLVVDALTAAIHNE